jgi:hypothetical protein
MTTLPPSQVGAGAIAAPVETQNPGAARGFTQKLERETRLELATLTLARLRSTN